MNGDTYLKNPASERARNKAVLPDRAGDLDRLWDARPEIVRYVRVKTNRSVNK